MQGETGRRNRGISSTARKQIGERGFIEMPTHPPFLPGRSRLFPPGGALALLLRRRAAERFERQGPHSRAALWTDLRGRISCAEPIFAAGLAPLQILERGANNALLFPPLAALRRCCRANPGGGPRSSRWRFNFPGSDHRLRQTAGPDG